MEKQTDARSGLSSSRSVASTLEKPLLAGSIHVDCFVCRKVPRSQSYQDVNGTTGDSQNTRLLLEEKEQALLASQETVQVR